MIFLFLKPSIVEPQTIQKDLDYLIIKINPPPEKLSADEENPLKPSNFREVSELKILALGTIWTYQKLISSQDVSACNFSPSCSKFSSEAFRRTGFIHGILLTSDRLQRCNGLPDIPRNYQFLSAEAKFSDPLDRYLKLDH